MQFGLSSQHLDFFTEHHYIEFEDLFSLEQIQATKEAIYKELQKKEKQLIETLSCEELFLLGRDLRKTNKSIEKIALHKKCGKIASSLFKAKKLRIAYDQAFVTTSIPGYIFQEPFSLQQISCFQPLVGGVILRLSESAVPNAPTDLLPKKVGSGLFFSATLPFPWSSLSQEIHQSFLLIAYGSHRLLYILEKKDRHTHLLKKMGYGFGDAVNNESNPIIVMR